MIFDHANASHTVRADGYEYTTVVLSTGGTVEARIATRVTFKINGRRTDRATAFEIVRADAAKMEREAKGDFRTEAEIIADRRAAQREHRGQASRNWAEIDRVSRMTDEQVETSREAMAELGEALSEGLKTRAHTIADNSPAERMAEINAEIDAKNKARLDAAFAASDARPDRLSTEGPEYEARRAVALAADKTLAAIFADAETVLVAELEDRVDVASKAAPARRFTVNEADVEDVATMAPEELVSAMAGSGAPVTPRTIIASLALALARTGWSIHELGANRSGNYTLGASIQPAYGGPIVATATAIGDMIAGDYGNIERPLKTLTRERLIVAALTTSTPA